MRRSRAEGTDGAAPTRTHNSWKSLPGALLSLYRALGAGTLKTLSEPAEGHPMGAPSAYRRGVGVDMAAVPGRDTPLISAATALGTSGPCPGSWAALMLKSGVWLAFGLACRIASPAWG